jgi:hypothetical protein
VVLQALQRAAAARAIWDHFNDLNNDQYIVSFFIGARFFLPSASSITEAEKAAERLKAAVGTGDFARIRDALRSTADPINKAYETMVTYQETTTGVAGDTKERLEFVRDASFSVVEAYAAFQLGATPASAAAAGGVGEAIKSLIGEASGTAIGIQPSISWGNVGLDALGGAAGGLVSELMPGVSKYLVGKLGGKWLTNAAVQKFVAAVLSGAGKGALEKAIETSLKLLKSNQKLSKEEFVKKVAEEMWKGFKWGALGGPLDDWIGKKFAKAVFDRMSGAQKLQFFGKKLLDKDRGKKAEEILEKVIFEKGSELVRKAVELSFGGAKGDETAEDIGKGAAENFAGSGLRNLQGEISKQSKAAGGD